MEEDQEVSQAGGRSHFFQRRSIKRFLKNRRNALFSVKERSPKTKSTNVDWCRDFFVSDLRKIKNNYDGVCKNTGKNEFSRVLLYFYEFYLL